MRYDLAQMYRGKRPRKRTVAFREVALPATLASDLYASVYGLVIREWEQGLSAINAEYERSHSELTTDAAPELSGVVVSVEAGINRLLVTLRLRLERWAARVEAAQRAKWAATVKRSTGLDISALVGPADVRQPLSVVIENNVALVRSVSDQTRDRISSAVMRGLSEKKVPREVAKDIREAVGMGRRRALNIASDQLSKASETLNEERRRQAGLSIWEWVSSHKVNYRPEHAARDGKRYSDDPADGAPPPNDRPGQLPFCGCTSRAVLSLTGEF